MSHILQREGSRNHGRPVGDKRPQSTWRGERRGGREGRGRRGDEERKMRRGREEGEEGERRR